MWCSFKESLERSVHYHLSRGMKQHLLFFLIFFNYYYYFFLLYNIVLVLPYINMHPPWVYTCSPSWTPLPPPSPYHPSGSSQCTSPKLPVSCIKPGLAIRFLYDIIHVSMPFSQIITHPPPRQSPKDCSIHLCLFCCLVFLNLSKGKGVKDKGVLCSYQQLKYNPQDRPWALLWF